jgi:hypothetical protein
MNAYVRKERIRFFASIGSLIVISSGLFLLRHLPGIKMSFDDPEWKSRVISVLMASAIVGVLAIASTSHIRILAENLVIRIDSDSITRIVDAKNDKRMGLISKLAYQSAETKHGVASSRYCRIPFDYLISVRSKNGKLVVTSKTSNWISGKDIIRIPKEISEYSAIEMLLKSQLSMIRKPS